MNRTFTRQFSQTGVSLRPGYSTVHPVHHLVKVEKAKLKPGLQNLLLPRDDIRSVKYKPTEICQDRVAEHYRNTLESDLLLHFYQHKAVKVEGNKKRTWSNDSPHNLFRGLRKPRGGTRATKDKHPITAENVPRLTSIALHAYNKNALEHNWLNISTRLQLSIITNVKAKQTYNKSNILPWKTRVGRPCGAKVELVDRDMNQFISTLTELVLPRIRAFKGISFGSGDRNGNISFGLSPEDVQFFPEFEHYQELFPNLNGMDITFKTTAQTDAQAKTLLSAYGFPFAKND
ncbi:mitochondrial 54S ribosomal protein uL5m [Lodderomyces beijingensis]|uniref:Large ribosomal subunit protein uL5 C-terminal domain-containing protein n=1 Tax=Lodderomyces beijingensis TaxID=1775926 RepID=A0ABP0ZJ92_9ASCO